MIRVSQISFIKISRRATCSKVNFSLQNWVLHRVPLLAQSYATCFWSICIKLLNIQKDFDVGTRRKTNPILRKLTRNGKIKEVHDWNIWSRLHIDSGYKRLKYVRYADDFLIGIIGSQADCVAIRDNIHNFLLNDLKLNLNLDNLIKPKLLTPETIQHIS